jgi:tetratricopeptide (TPR) repeat protein
VSPTNKKDVFIRFGFGLSRLIFIILIFLGLFILFVVWGMFLSMHYYYLAEGMDEKLSAEKKLYATKSISYDSTNGASYMILGTVSMKEGNYPDALSKTTRAKMSYNIVNLFKQFSLVYQKLGNFQSAIDYFKAALRVYPADIDTILGLGSVYYFIGDYKQAVEEFEKGFFYNPFNENLHLAISEAYVKLGELDKAVSKLRSVLLMSPNNTKALENLAKIYIDKGIYLDEAITILQGLIRTKTDARNYASLAMAFYKKGDWVNAIRNVKRAASLAPNDRKIAEYEKFLLMKYGENSK